MRLSINWLRQYVEIKESATELADMLTMLGFEAEIAVELLELNNIVIAQVETVEKHPNADKLFLCQVNDGSETVPVVCGAPNVATGQKVVFAKVGAVLPGDFKITKAKIRGELSFGMICAEDELGISENHDGIMVLPEDTKIGLPIGDALNDIYASLELDLTPNRPDALSHFGIAREVALKTGRKLKLPSYKRVNPEIITENISVNIDDQDGCPRYIAGVVDNIKIGPSPKWMKELLESAGQRSINNVVDISNFVLLEIGHPTHIFDFRQLPTKTIGVRRAKAGEEFVTLDEEKHKLEPYHLLITDGKEPVALAGIMGGLGSMVQDDTKKVLIESAYFDPITIRKGSKSLGMLTESSRRFERGAAPEGAVIAFYRIVSLLEEYASGELVSEVVDAYPKKIISPSIVLHKSELDLVAGIDISNNDIEKSLSGLNIEWKVGKDDSWTCIPPSFRPDLEREIDLIEEIIRIYGYDKVPSSVGYGSIFEYNDPDPQVSLSKIINAFTGVGFRQCYNNSLQSKNNADSSGVNSVATINPLSQNLSHLRTSLLPGLLENTNYNIKNGNSNLQLFEIGQIHSQAKPGFKGILETMEISGIMHGVFHNTNVHAEDVVNQSFFTLKGILEYLFVKLLHQSPNFIEDNNKQYQKCYRIEINGEIIGNAGIINKKLMSKLDLDIEKDVFGFELDGAKILELLKIPAKYQTVSKFPTIERDLNLVVDEAIEAGQIIKTIENMNVQRIKSVKPVNIFKHDSLGENKKSILYSIVFQDDNKTLEDKDVNSIINEIISIATKRFSAKLRT